MNRTLLNTKRTWLMLFVLLGISLQSAFAQVSTYTFASSSGTYTPITGGTVLGTTTNDDNSFGGFLMDFPFSYSGAVYSHFGVNTNGFITLGTSATTALPVSSYTPISSGTSNNVISAFAADLQAGAVSGELSYTTLGVTPNRTLVIQWKDYRPYGGTSLPYNFQVRLNETSNVITIVYGTFLGVARTPQVGLRGLNNSDYNNRTTTTDWSATTAGTVNSATCAVTATVFPASGQTFTFSPNLTACVVPGGVNVTNLNSTSATLNWASSPLSVGGYNVEYRLASTAPAGAFTQVTGSPFAGTTANVTGLALSTAYQWRVQSICAGPTTSTLTPDFYQNNFTTLSACAAPTTLVASGITTTDATLSWTGNLTATNYNLEYRQVGAPTYTSVAVAGTTTTLTGLLVGTSYQWRVTSNCAGATPTATSVLGTFATVCTVSSLPYQQDFESITVNDQLPNCMARSSASICKTYIAAQTTYNRIPRSGTKFASFQYGTAATGDYFYTAPIQMTAGTTYQFSTWYIVDATGGWTALDAWVGPNQNPTGLVAIPGASVTSPNIQTYQELASTFTVPTTGVYYVALRAVGTGFTPWYLSFDDMFVGLPPACIVPNGITASTLGNTTATVNWNATPGSTGYNVQYRPVGAPTFTAFAGNPITVGNSVNLTGLSASTNYEIQIQNICSAVLTSTYSFSGSFATTCAPVNVFPYFEGFEGISVDGELPNCMARTSPTLCLTYTAAQPIGAYNRDPRTGNKFASFYYNSVVGGNYFYSAPLALVAGKTYDFSTWYITDGRSGWVTLDAWVGPNQNPTGLVAIAGATVSAPINTIYQQLAGSFVPATTGVYYVALRCVATTPPYYLSFDDMSVDSPCTGATFTTQTLPAGSTVATYNQTIAATGGVAPYTFTVTAGTLPAGLTLDPTTGVISGTPTVISITPPNFTVTISDATSCNSNKNYSIVVTGAPCTPISVTPTTVPAATLGVLYTPNAVQFVASGVAGATYAYTIVSGSLPTGMSLNSTNGNLTGTPTSVPASSIITIKARVTTGPSAGCFGTVDITLVVNCPVMTFGPATIPDAVVNLQYSQQFSATYGTVPVTTGFTFSTTSTLPQGFTLSAGGVLSGINIDVIAPMSITIKATRTNGCNISKTYMFGVAPTIAAPTVLKPTQISSSSFRARWTPVPRATKYRLYIATSPTFDGGTFATGYVGVEVVGDTSVLVQNLKSETKYYIQVTAISSAAEVSPYSNIENGTTLSAVTSIDNALSSQVKVSPNPSNDKFSVDFGTLNLGKTTARVFDAQGKQVLSSEINGNQTTISLGNMANGIYLLEISSNKGRILKRLVKE